MELAKANQGDYDPMKNKSVTVRIRESLRDKVQSKVHVIYEKSEPMKQQSSEVPAPGPIPAMLASVMST